MTVTFTAPTFYWRGPAPFVYVGIPRPVSDEIRSMSKQLTYGWGVIPVKVTLGGTTWTTSLFPKDGLYLVPIKKAVQAAEGVGLDQDVEISVEF